MSKSETLISAECLAQQIRDAGSAERLLLRPEFLNLLNKLRSDGEMVPRGLLQLDVELCDEETERRFDNMPV